MSVQPVGAHISTLALFGLSSAVEACHSDSYPWFDAGTLMSSFWVSGITCLLMYVRCDARHLFLYSVAQSAQTYCAWQGQSLAVLTIVLELHTRTEMRR